MPLQSVNMHRKSIKPRGHKPKRMANGFEGMPNAKLDKSPATSSLNSLVETVFARFDRIDGALSQRDKLIVDLKHQIDRHQDQLNLLHEQMKHFLTLQTTEENESLRKRYGKDALTYLDVLRHHAASKLDASLTGNQKEIFVNSLAEQMYYSLARHVRAQDANVSEDGVEGGQDIENTINEDTIVEKTFIEVHDDNNNFQMPSVAANVLNVQHLRPIASDLMSPIVFSPLPDRMPGADGIDKLLAARQSRRFSIRSTSPVQSSRSQSQPQTCSFPVDANDKTLVSNTSVVDSSLLNDTIIQRQLPARPSITPSSRWSVASFREDKLAKIEDTRAQNAQIDQAEPQVNGNDSANDMPTAKGPSKKASTKSKKSKKTKDNNTSVLDTSAVPSADFTEASKATRSTRKTASRKAVTSEEKGTVGKRPRTRSQVHLIDLSTASTSTW